MPTIDPRLVVDVAIAAAAAGWLGLLGLTLLITRPRVGAALPPSQEFPGDEPPAVVSLITGGWALTEHAAESTLLDLAARRHLELRQPGNDPRHTTIHLGTHRPTGLTPYEQRVFDRVANLAVRGVLPLTALTFRDAGQALQWSRRLAAEVVADARARGLSRRRISPAVVGLLTFAALGPAAAVAMAVMHAQQRGGHQPDYYWVLMAAVMTLGFLSSAAGRPWGERDTARGREAAARWLGLKAYLRRDGNFANLPPSAVAVWDRYLSYGDALGVTRVCATVLDLGLGNRRRVWSSFGGTWHQVRVRYPRLWPRYGQRTRDLVGKGILALGAGYALIRYRPVILGFDVPIGPDGLSRTVLQVLIPVLVAYGGYTVLAAVATAVTPVTVTGEVLWLQVWKSSRPDGERPPVPWLFHLAVDDGRRDCTVAWGLPAHLERSFDSGDVVAIKARRWTRRIIELRVTGRREPFPVTAAADSQAGSPRAVPDQHPRPRDGPWL